MWNYIYPDELYHGLRTKSNTALYSTWRYTHSDELYHAWGSNEDHKYIARVPNKDSKSSKNKYRYFYSKEAYEAYLRGDEKKLPDTNAEAAKQIISDVQNLVKGVVKKREDKKAERKRKNNEARAKFEYEAAKELYDEYGSDRLKDDMEYWEERVKEYGSDKPVEEKSEKTEEKKSVVDKKVDDLLKDTEELAEDIVDFYDNPTYDPASDKKKVKVDTKKDAELKKAYPKLSKEDRDKLQDPNERKAYDERLKYQKNAPDFMDDIPRIDEKKVNTKLEDQAEVNEDYDPYVEATEWWSNSVNCTAAYELRRRGYDVEAEEASFATNDQLDRMYDYFEGAELKAINADGSSFTLNEDFLRKMYSGDDISDTDISDNKRDYDFYGGSQEYSAEKLTKAITDNNPPGSRGCMDVYDKSGNIRSVAYEVDNKGTVVIRDTHRHDEMDVSELASSVSSIIMTRTDNLKLKEGIKAAVRPNQSKRDNRNYVINNGKVYNYAR